MKKFPIICLFISVLFASCENDTNSDGSISLPIRVDYSKSIVQLLEEGNYDFVEENLYKFEFVENFKINIPKDSVEVLRPVLLNFNREMKSQDVITQMKSRGLRPGSARELYVFAAGFNEEIRIVALGSVMFNLYVPAILIFEGDNGYRDATYLSSSLDTDWKEDFVFLAFRERE